MSPKLARIYSALMDIGVAIREKLGESDTYTLMQMPDKIRQIGGGGEGEYIKYITVVDLHPLPIEYVRKVKGNAFTTHDMAGLDITSYTSGSTPINLPVEDIVVRR